MRLGLYIPFLDDRPAGVGVYIEEVCSRLCRNFSDVVVYTGSPDAKRDWLEGAAKRSLAPPLPHALPHMKGAARRMYRLVWLSTFAGRQLVRDAVDVLFCPVQEGPTIGPVPSCVVVHDLTALKVQRAFHWLSVLQTKWLLPPMLRHASAVIAVSENTRRDVVERFGLAAERISVIGEGYDLSVFYPRAAEETEAARQRFGLPERYMLYAGTFSRHKNLKVLLDAMARLGPAENDIVLALAGRSDAGAYEEFVAHAGALGLQARVKVLGYVERDVLATLMSGAAAFVFPSLYEGFGLAPLEAMACGATVVASGVASLPEVVGAGGILVDGTGAAEWARSIAVALKADRLKARERATQQASRFDWDTVARRIADVVRTAAERQTPSSSQGAR